MTPIFMGLPLPVATALLRLYKERDIRRVLAAAKALLPLVGELDEDGEFVPLPQASLTGTERSRIAPWLERTWRDLGNAIDATEQQ